MMKTFKVFCLLPVLATATVLRAASPERYLHVNVNNPNTHELVRINLPLSLAEKVIPAVNHGQLQNGKVRIGDFPAQDLDVRALLAALKSAPEGEFVNVQQPDDDVRVAKERGQLVAHVVDRGGKQKVDITIPWEVAEALLLETKESELNISAAVKALEKVGDMTLVTVVSQEESVRIWIDSNNTDK